MAAAPSGTVDGLYLDEVGTGADIAERSDVVAEGGLLPWHLKVLHEREVVLGEVCHGPAAAADENEDVGGMGVAIGGSASRGLGREG